MNTRRHVPSIVSLAPLVNGGRQRVIASTQGLFSHGDYPLACTLAYGGDAGLFGPGSATWTIVGDTSVFVGAIRALLLQAAHPEVAAGVFEHSRYHQDPLGRLTRTESYVTATSFGAMPEVEAAVARVRRRHGPIHGFSHRGLPYDASDPGLDAGHNSLTDSFLTAFKNLRVAAVLRRSRRPLRGRASASGPAPRRRPVARNGDRIGKLAEFAPRSPPSPGSAEAVSFCAGPRSHWEHARFTRSFSGRQ